MELRGLYEYTIQLLLDMGKKNKISSKQLEELFAILKSRFEANRGRHPNIKWADIQAKMDTYKNGGNSDKLWSILEMERTGGEPDIIQYDLAKDEFLIIDCSAESPKGRRSVCFDREGQDSRKEHRPKDNAIDMAASMGIELLDEEMYRKLQSLGEFDLKTSSWVQTPPEIRALGGALFCDRRYDHVFLYHNGAQSYYAARGFRGFLKL